MILDLLREKMKEASVDAYIIPTLDPHGSEYLPEHFKDRKFVTGFTGSAGTALVTKDKALLWTDGRYFIQAQREIKDYGFELMKMGIEGYPSLNEWIVKNLSDNSKIAFNYECFLEKDYELLKEDTKNKNIEFLDKDLVKDLWKDRPALSDSKVFIHDIKYAGKSSEEKLDEIRAILKEKDCDLTIINSLDDIAWIFNIRSNDIEFTPVVISYCLIDQDKAYIFLDKNKLDDEVSSYIEKFAEIKDYKEIFDFISNYKDKTIYMNPSKMNRKLFELAENSNKIVKGNDISSNLKACKNKVELENIRNAHIKDGVALTKYIYWLKNKADLKNLNEYEVSEKLLEFRKEQDGFIEESFYTISAYGPNAAMMHYSATADKNSKLNDKGLYLVDSGGQYLDGTTDITRTIALGELTDEEVKDFTYVLKSHLTLLDMVFLKGTIDKQLDTVARAPIWSINYDYKCGTGHGVGYLLGVHEAPPSLGTKSVGAEIQLGMVFSDEPGIYRENKHGIRTENLVEVVEDVKNESGSFYKLESISFAPIDLDAVDKKYLNELEIAKLNKYHKDVYEKISPYLNEEEKVWLKEVTREI